MARGAREVDLDPSTVEPVHPAEQGAQPRRPFGDIAQTHLSRPLRARCNWCVSAPGAAYSGAQVHSKAAGSGLVTVLYEVCPDGRVGGRPGGPRGRCGASGARTRNGLRILNGTVSRSSDA
ncbi:hypothetical protein GCM10010519_64660 [Streptomyces lactacystinicus]